MTTSLRTTITTSSAGFGRRVTHPSGSSPLVRSLVAEWEAMVARPRTVRTVNGWGLPGGPVETLDEVLDRAGFGHEPTWSEGDRYLATLVIRAQQEDLAGRIVLQRLLPPLIAIAARRGRLTPGGFNEAFATTISHAWILIRTYPIERRPAKIAANLVRDAEYHGFVREARMKKVVVQHLGERSMHTIPAPERRAAPEEELADVLEDAIVHGLHARHATVLRRVGRGDSYEQIARDEGVTARTVRAWRRDALSELRARTPSAG
jgi:hypothetical protein